MEDGTPRCRTHTDYRWVWRWVQVTQQETKYKEGHEAAPTHIGRVSAIEGKTTVTETERMREQMGTPKKPVKSLI